MQRSLVVLMCCLLAKLVSAQNLPSACTAKLSANNNAQSVAQFIWAGCPQLLQWPHDDAIRMSGPAPSGQASVHGFVFNYYDPKVVAWLKAGQPPTPLPDGTLIIKQMYQTNNGKPGAISGWAIMVKQQSASYDGWFWGYVDPQKSQGGDGAFGGQFYDPNCVGCHASANTRELTFSALQNMSKQVRVTAMPERNGLSGGSEHSRLSRILPTIATPTALKASQNPVPHPLPPQSSDKVIVGPKGPTGFVSNDVCAGCHDASNLALGVQPHMTSPAGVGPAQPPTVTLTNFSMWSEWSASLMGLAARDPVFQAQRESETKLYPEVAAEIDNTCYSCHAAMGQRTLVAKDPKALYTHAHFLATTGPYAEVGALGRDGVSCAVCHRITPEGLGTEASFTAKFKVADPLTVFGPYLDVATYPMQNSVGITPKHGSALQDPAMCGSCHVVQTPILDRNKKYTREGYDKAKKSHEQTTYLEWLNSSFSTKVAKPSPTAQTCQNCHMSNHLHGKPLTSKIANIEDNTYVDADGKIFPNTAPASQITLKPRAQFGRHTLVGANLITLEMFRQFGGPLGLSLADPNYDTSRFKFLDRFALSTEETKEQSVNRSAQVTVGQLVTTAEGLMAPITVINLSGHKLPSGVGFRRAFLTVEALDASGQVLWASGRSNAQGVIVDAAGNALPTEFSKTQWQPHHKLITSESQVQIYETRSKDTSGLLTTSFLGLADDVKDNRLLPQGWAETGPYASWTKPIGVDKAANPGYWQGRGRDQLMVRIPLSIAPKVQQVRASLNYQSLPPYYLADRFQVGGDGPMTQNLKGLVAAVNLKGTAADGWKVTMARASRMK